MKQYGGKMRKEMSWSEHRVGSTNYWSCHCELGNLIDEQLGGSLGIQNTIK